MKAKELILRILQIRPNLSTTKLVKLCYLFDLGWTQLHGEQKTELPYQWWHHGPYSKDFDRAVWELEASGRIRTTPYKTAHQHDCILHSAVDTKAPRIGKEEELVLHYVLERFADWDLEKLLEFVYATPPMLEAKAKNQQFRRLNMKSRAKIRGSLLDAETAKMILESELTDRSQYIAAEVALRKLQAAGV